MIRAKLYYIFSLLYFLRKIKNKKEVAGNLLPLLSARANCIVTLYPGFKFKVRDLYDLLALKEVFADEIYGFVFRDIKENTTLIDLGAYIGDSVVYAQKFRRVKKIVALEPMPENYKISLVNLKLNKVKNVKLLKAAVADKRGEASLYIHPNKGQSGFWKKTDKTEKIGVKTMTLSDILKLSAGQNLILKCDCEGAEYEMFMTAGTGVLKKFQRIVFEYHDDKKLLQIIKKLNKAGFQVTRKKHPVEKNLGTAYAA